MRRNGANPQGNHHEVWEPRTTPTPKIQNTATTLRPIQPSQVTPAARNRTRRFTCQPVGRIVDNHTVAGAKPPRVSRTRRIPCTLRALTFAGDLVSELHDQFDLR
jgi:hypothetical protein